MSKKVMLIAGVSAALVLILMGTGFFLIWKKVSTFPPAAAEQAKQEEGVQGEGQGKEEEAEEEEEKEPGPIVPLESFIVNLADEGGQRYLRITMQMELSDKKLEKEIEKRLPKIRDSVLMILPNKKSDDIRTGEGKEQVREEIIAAINESLITGTVDNLYFTEFVIQ